MLQNTEEMNMQLIQYLDGNEDGQVDSLEWTIRLNDTLGFEFEQEDIYISVSNMEWTIVYGETKLCLFFYKWISN